MSNLDLCFTVVCITETWLNNVNVNTMNFQVITMNSIIVKTK